MGTVANALAKFRPCPQAFLYLDESSFLIECKQIGLATTIFLKSMQITKKDTVFIRKFLDIAPSLLYY